MPKLYKIDFQLVKNQNNYCFSKKQTIIPYYGINKQGLYIILQSGWGQLRAPHLCYYTF